MTVPAAQSAVASRWWARDDAPVAVSDEARLAFGGVVAFTIILLLAPQNFLPFLRPFRIAFLAAGIAGASLLWERWKEHKPAPLNREILMGLGLLAWSFITLPLSYWPGGSMALLTQLYIKSVIVFWLLANVITTPLRLRRMAVILMCCTVPLAVTALKNFMSGVFLQESNITRIVGYETGLAQNPNDLALMLNLLLPLSVALFRSATGTTRLICLVIAGMNAVAVVVTFSRAGFLGLATIAATYFFIMIRRQGADRRWALAMIACAIMSLPLLPQSYLDRLSTVTNIEADTTGSAQVRWRDTVAAATFISDHPIIGAGVGMDVLALNEVRGQKWYQVHNVYLQYGVDLGLPGLILFLMFFRGVFVAASSSRRRLDADGDDRDVFLLSEAVMISLTAFAVCAFFYPVAYNFYFYYIAGLALAVRAVTDQVLASRCNLSHS